MRPEVPTHPNDDRLLELAYGEVPASEARTLRQHVDGCARCRKVLEGIAEVRTAFRAVPTAPAPERGLESLLAYGEQAAARARSRRGGLRILALLSAATAFAVVWLVLPSRQPEELARVPSTPATDALAQAEVPRSAAQGDRARDEVDRAKDVKENETKAPAPSAVPRAKTEVPGQEQPARRSAPEGFSKQKGVEKLDAPAEQRKLAEAPATRPSDHEIADRSAEASNLSGTIGVAGAVGGKSGAASAASPMAGPGTLGSESMKKRAAGGRLDQDGPAATARQAPSSPAPGVAAVTPSPGDSRGVDRAQQAAKVAAAPVAELVASEDKATAAADVGSAAATPPAKNASKPVPPAQSMRMGAISPEKQARLAEVKRQLETATGDPRKALLMERCELEASLQLGPDAVLSCSMVTREFPGTPEAKRAGEIARGFSLQLPAEPER